VLSIYKSFRVFTFFFLFQGLILIYGYYFKDPHATGIVGVFNRYYWKTLFSWSFYFMTGGVIGVHYDKFVYFVERNIKGIFIGYIFSTIFYIDKYITISGFTVVGITMVNLVPLGLIPWYTLYLLCLYSFG